MSKLDLKDNNMSDMKILPLDGSEVYGKDQGPVQGGKDILQL